MRIAVNVNGRLSDDGQATISVFDHGFLYGEGVYETLRTYDRRPFLLGRHLNRLRASAAAIGLAVPLDDAGFAARIDATMAAVDAEGPPERYIRLVLTRGVGDLSYDPQSCPEPSLVIIARPHREIARAVRERGIGVVVSSRMRNHPDALSPRIKSNNLLNNALAMQEALRAGADEALMCNYRGEIAECAQSNIFLVRGGEALTPPLATGLLEGVTRNFLFEVGPEIGIAVRERTLRLDEIGSADEIFITSTTREVLPVTRLDGGPVGAGVPGPVTEALADAFRRRARAAGKTSRP